MATAAELRAQYESYTPVVSEFMLTGDESDLAKKINEAADYNRPIRAEQAQNLAGRGQVIDRYNSTVDPLINGLDVDQRERLKSYDMNMYNSRAAELGSYMAAREGTLADTVKAWKDAWNIKYQSMKEQQQAKKDAWQMAFDQEREQQRAKEAAASLAAQYAQIAATKANNTKQRTSLQDAVNYVGGSFRNKNGKGESVAEFGYTTADGKKAWKTREQIGREIAAETGVGYNEVMKQIYSTYKGSNGY
jgi:hypothetical protein